MNTPVASFVERQNKEVSLLNDIYRNMPIGIEQKFLRASRVADSLGYKASFVDHAVRGFEMMGILSRRLEFGAKDDKGQTVSGRSYHWTLLIPKEEAIVRLNKYHEKERQASKGISVSLKTRIMEALTSYEKFETVDGLAKVVRRNGENLDFHHMTHVMESLAHEGKITFDRGTTKDHIPYNIRLTKKAKQMPLPIVVEEPPIFVARVTETNPSAIPVVPATEGYPIIERLIKRREWLESAARLAEDASEEDIAITLLDRANKPMTALEAEAVHLYAAYINCKQTK